MSLDAENRFEKIEKDIEEIVRRIEKFAGSFGEEIETRFDKIKYNKPKHHRRNQVSGFLLIGVGLYWLGSNLGWFSFDLPLWPLVIIALGVYAVFESR